jgi:hypothetical protein
MVQIIRLGTLSMINVFGTVAQPEGPKSVPLADAGSAQSTAKNNLLMQLRKCCAHPSLLSASPGIEHGQALSDYVAASGKLALLDQMVCT